MHDRVKTRRDKKKKKIPGDLAMSVCVAVSSAAAAAARCQARSACSRSERVTIPQTAPVTLRNHQTFALRDPSDPLGGAALGGGDGKMDGWIDRQTDG